MVIIPVLGKLWHKLKASLGYSEFQDSLTVSVPLYPSSWPCHTHTPEFYYMRPREEEQGEKPLRTTMKGGWGNRKEVGQHLPH